MSVVTRAALKAYFTVGSVVDESDMIDFIDSISHNDEDERSVSVFLTDPGEFTGAYAVIMQVTRAITITHYSAMNDAGGPTMTHKLVSMGGGSSLDVAANSTTINDVLTDTSFPTVTIASASIAAGQTLAVYVTGTPTSPNTTFTIRYKDA